MKTPSFTLLASLSALAELTVLLDPAIRKAIATDGEAIAILPLPEGFDTRRMISIPQAFGQTTITPSEGTETEDSYDLDLLATTPAYRVALNPAKLAALAAEMGAGELCIIEFPANPQDGPMRILPPSGEEYGFLMPQPLPPEIGTEGLLGVSATETPIQDPQSTIPPKAELPPPVVTTSAERKTVEVFFGGRPPKEITQAIGRNGLGFSYSGERGTKRGVPARTWYAPDNEFFRTEVAKLLQVQVQQAA